MSVGRGGVRGPKTEGLASETPKKEHSKMTKVFLHLLCRGSLRPTCTKWVANNFSSEAFIDRCVHSSSKNAIEFDHKLYSFFFLY